MVYVADEKRYEKMQYSRCGNSGLKLPKVSLGFWHNFGDNAIYETAQNMVRRAFDLGITHFDLANNYGPEPGSAEKTFGRIFNENLKPYRDEIVISSKAGYYMWPGPYGEWGSRKYLISSLDQSLKRMGLEYVDIFYHHRPDPDTPIEETMAALDYIVRSGKALYVGISNYNADQASEAIKVLKELGTPCLIHQPCYSMLNRWVEDGLLDVLSKEKVGCIAFSPLAGGRLTDRYLNGIPSDSRAAGESGFLSKDNITEAYIDMAKKLNELAKKRGQTLSQMALSWVLKDERVTSVLIGASKVSQIEDCVKCIENTNFTDEELKLIDSLIK